MVSTITGLAIQNNEVFVDAYQDQVSQKWGYVITLGESDLFRPLATYSAVYPSSSVAREKGDEMVEEIRNFDFSPELAKMRHAMGGASGLVDKIVDAVKRN